MSDSSDNEVSCTSPDAMEAENNTPLKLVPLKSRAVYEKTYFEFTEWCKTKEISTYTEDVLLQYFSEKSGSRKPSSLWSYYSMLNTTLSVYDNLDISQYLNLVAFLKKQKNGYTPKKSNVFTRDQINKFLLEASDDLYLMDKVALMFGVVGACRRDELTNLSIEDIEDTGSSLLVSVRHPKTNASRMFVVINNKSKCPDLLDIYRNYVSLRPPNLDHKRLFINYKNKKCSKHPVGKNVFDRIPFKIATYLKLENPELYTGYSFRRASTLLTNARSQILDVGSYGGGNSTSVPEQCALKTEQNDPNNAGQMVYENKQDTCVTINLKSEREQANITLTNCNNCVLNINF